MPPFGVVLAQDKEYAGSGRSREISLEPRRQHCPYPSPFSSKSGFAGQEEKPSPARGEEPCTNASANLDRSFVDEAAPNPFPLAGEGFATCRAKRGLGAKGGGCGQGHRRTSETIRYRSLAPAMRSGSGKLTRAGGAKPRRRLSSSMSVAAAPATAVPAGKIAA